jgi:hypothetical protein
MDSGLKKNWTGSTGSFGSYGLRPKGPSPQAKKILYPVKSLLCEISTAFNRRLIAGVRPTSRDQNAFNWG